MTPKISSLHTMRLPGPGQHKRLTRDLIYEDDDVIITVPQGFIADGNSGPIRNSEYDPAGWVHDLLYRKDASRYIHFKRLPFKITRKWADRIYRKIVRIEGGSLVGASADYAVLRLVGWRHWHRLEVL